MLAALAVAIAAFSSVAQAASNFQSTPDSTGTVLTITLPSSGAVDVLLSSTNDASDVTHLADYATATKVVFALTSSGSGNCWFDSNVTIDKAVQIGNDTANSGLYFDNGSSGKTLTLAGTLTGTGVISLKGAGGETGSRGRKTISITGDTSDFGGNIVMDNSGAGKITFGDGSAASTNSSTDGVIGSGTISLDDRTRDVLAFNYGGTDTVYITNSFSGNGTVKNEGTAAVDFNHATFAAQTTLAVDTTSSDATYSDSGLSGIDNIILDGTFSGRLGNSGTGTLTISGGELGGAGNDSTGSTSVTGGTIGTVTTNAGSTNISGGTITKVDAHDGTTHILAPSLTVNEVRGGNSSSATLNIGSTEVAANLTANYFYGHFEHSSSDANSNKTTVNVNGSSTLKVQNMLQIARDGKGYLNIGSNATVIARRLDMGTANNWTGTKEGQGKYAELNLSGKLYVGADGITQEYNHTDSPGQINLKAGSTLGTSELGATGNTYGWTSVLDMTIEGATKLNTSTYENQNSSTITLNGVLSGDGGITKEGAGTLVLSGANTYAGGTTIQTGSVEVKNAAALGNGNVTVNGGTLKIGTTEDNAVNLGADDRTMTINNSGTLQTNHGVALTGALIMNDGATLDLTGFSLSSTTFAGSGTAVLTTTGELSVGSIALTGTSEGAVIGLNTADNTLYASELSSLGIMDVTDYDAATQTLTFSTNLDVTHLFGNVTFELTDGKTWGEIGTQVYALVGDWSTMLNLSFENADGTTINLSGVTGLTLNNYSGENFTVAADGLSVGSYAAYMIPEPTTATLSLLALAGLAARRRRK